MERAVGNPTRIRAFTVQGTELWNSMPLDQFKMAPPVEQELSIYYPLSGLSGAKGPALSPMYPVSVMHLAWLGKI